MELKKGYKQTEVGLIPEDWEISLWGNKLKGFITGATPYRGNQSFYKGNIKWVTSGELNYNVIYETIEHISEEAREKTNLKIHPSNTFLMAITGLEAAGTRGSCAILGVPATTNQSCMAIYGTEALDIKYLYYYYLKYGEELAFKYCQGTKQQSYTAKIVKQLPIFYPPSSDEQQAIVSVLSDVDELILSLEKLIAKKKNIKLGAMQELLTGKKRLPGFTGEWRNKLIANIADIVSGGTPSTAVPNFWNGTIRWCTPTDITNCTKKYLSSTEKSISVKGLENCSATILPTGTLLLCSRATIGEVRIASVPVCTNQGFKSLVVQDGTNNEWLYYKILTLKDKLIERAIGSTFLEISKKDLASIEILVPSYEEQTAIATILADMDNEIEALEQKLLKYRNIKQGMMQELLTGRIRLVEKTAVAIDTTSPLLEEKHRLPSHNKEFDEAVVISVLSATFGNEQFPMTAFRRQKFAYLLHRYCSGKAEGYGKYAAGPFNPNTAYGGPEKIAQSKGYVKWHKTKTYAGFIAGENAAEATSYFEAWYGKEVLNWLEQFRYVKKEELELLATVDMAITDLQMENREITAESVRMVIQNSEEWKAKLDRAIFSDTNIIRAIKWSKSLFHS